LELLARLDRRRFEPALVSSDGVLTRNACAIPDLPMTLLPSLRRQIHPWADGLTWARLTGIIRRGRFDIVHTHSSKAGILGRWAARAARTPVVVHTVHGFGFHAFQRRPIRRLYQGLERLTSRVTSAFITPSARDCETGVQLGIGAPEQYRVIRYGLTPDRLVPAADRIGIREELGIPAAAPLVGTIACLKPQKAPEDFVEAFRRIVQRVPDVHALWVGDGALRPHVERLQQALGLTRSLHLLGWRTDVPRLLAAMDVFVLASRWEGLPIACLEALAAGVPIVATAAGGIPEVVADGRNGLLVPIAEPARLADAVVRLLQDAALRQRMREANRRAPSGQYPVEGMVEAVERLYEDLLAKEAGARC
jgi:glycosyltransferase involved in cell wall biosynthesis